MESVWVNGCFDVLHVGHIRLLQFAKKHGCRLIVGVDSDNRVKGMKGENRPINTVEDRKEMLNALHCVEDAVSFNTDEELRSLIEAFKIDIMVVGREYEGKKVIGSELVDEVIYFDKVGDYSTTNIVSNGTQN